MGRGEDQSVGESVNRRKTPKHAPRRAMYKEDIPTKPHLGIRNSVTMNGSRRRHARLLDMSLEDRVSHFDPLVSGSLESYKTLFSFEEKESNPDDETLWRFLPHEKKRKFMREKAIEKLRKEGFDLPSSKEILDAIGNRDSASIYTPPILAAIIEQGTQVSFPGIIKAEWYERSELKKNTYYFDIEEDLWMGQGFPALSKNISPKKVGWSWSLAPSDSLGRGALEYPFVLSKFWRFKSSTDGSALTKAAARHQLDRLIDRVTKKRMKEIKERQAEWEERNGKVNWSKLLN